MIYEEAIKFIHSKSWKGTKLGLDRIIELNELIGNPQKQLKFVHVAGTNGKGSTSRMLANILNESGYRVGLFTSPFISTFNEYYQVNDRCITDSELIEIVEFIKPFVEKMKEGPTEFELITMIAVEYFKRKCCDIVVFEVGMGGRLDCTNFIENTEVAVITSIGLDHMEQLGNTISEIAREKAGIIKRDCQVVLYQQGQEVVNVVEEACKKVNADLFIADFSDLIPVSSDLDGQMFDYKNMKNIFIKLLGCHQLKNTAVVLETVFALQKRGWKIGDADIKEGLKKTTWPARFEVLQKNPVVILDGGHNPQCFQALKEGLIQYFPGKKITFVFGVLADKDYISMIDIIAPYAKKFYTITPNNTRALNAEDLTNCLRKYNSTIVNCETPLNGIKTALEGAQKEDVICVVGSFSIASEIRSFYGR